MKVARIRPFYAPWWRVDPDRLLSVVRYSRTGRSVLIIMPDGRKVYAPTQVVEVSSI